MKKYLFLLLIIASNLKAQSVDELFISANNLYKEGDYARAIEMYKAIEVKENVSSALYYNLGNCYYKLNKVAATIYNYEKALLLDPLNEDAATNLIFAKRLTLDNIEELPKTFLQKFNENVLQKLSYNAWAGIAITFSFLGTLFFLLFYFSRISSKKRSYFILSTLSFLCLIVSVFITINQHNIKKNTVEAIIFAESAIVKNAPTLNSEAIFTLHEGTKVNVLDGVDNWKKIKLADGKTGWMNAEELKVFTLF